MLAEVNTPLESSSPLTIGQAVSHLERAAHPPHTFNLTLRGYLTTGWSGRLAAGLAQHGISVVRGEAERSASQLWHASLEIKSTPLAQNPFGIDYVALSKREPPPHRAAPIELNEFLLEPPARHGGSLYLEIKGKDRIGFLGDLLDYFSFNCLFPVRMKIETVGSNASDSFWLRGVASSVPSESLYAELRRSLEGLTASRVGSG